MTGPLEMFLVLLLIANLRACVYTPYGWSLQQNATTTTNDTMCNSTWSTLLQRDPSHLVLAENQMWLLAFGQYAAAVLNERTVGDNDTGVMQALLLVGDSLERACGNMSQWQLDSAVKVEALTLLSDYNHGRLLGQVACEQQFGSGDALDTFYYFNSNDVITVRNPARNITIINSVLDGILSRQYGLYVLVPLLTLLLFAFIVKLIMVLHRNHQYKMNRRSQESNAIGEYEMATRDGNIQTVHTTTVVYDNV